VRRWSLALGATATLIVLVGLAAALYDRPPATPGAWLARGGLEARFLTVNGHRLRYVRCAGAADRSVVVLVHGFGSSLYTWKDVLASLSPSHDVIALDLPGFGASDRPADLSFEDLPAAVLGLMDRLGVGRAALVGHSMGGAVVAVLAADRPERVSGLILVDAAGFNLDRRAQPGMVRLVASPMAPFLARLPVKRLLVEHSLREVLHDGRHLTDERLSEYLAAARRPGTAAAMRSLILSLGGRSTAVKDRLPLIQAPTLVIWGREDRWIPLAHADLFVEAIPGARKVVLDSCGHMPQAEEPEVVGRLLQEFLDGSAGASGGGGLPPPTAPSMGPGRPK
jgi:pimeloyl-ACP methyl ester carboxylesterase